MNTIRELTDRYNQLATQLGRKTLKKFETKAQGLARVAELQALVKPTAKSVAKRAGSVSAFCREQILAGLADATIMDLLLARGLDENKAKSYPAWNRWDMKRKGLIEA